MECPKCSESTRKFGKTTTGKQRYRCDGCKKTFTPETDTTLGAMRLEMDKAVAVIQHLIEG